MMKMSGKIPGYAATDRTDRSKAEHARHEIVRLIDAGDWWAAASAASAASIDAANEALVAVNRLGSSDRIKVDSRQCVHHLCASTSWAIAAAAVLEAARVADLESTNPEISSEMARLRASTSPIVLSAQAAANGAVSHAAWGVWWLAEPCLDEAYQRRIDITEAIAEDATATQELPAVTEVAR